MKTTRGCELLVAIRDGTDIDDETKKLNKTWIPLKDIKQSHPIQVAEFAVARGIEKLPQFAWWVKHTLKKRDGIIAATKARIAKSAHKYGVEVPTSVKHAREIDRKNGKPSLGRSD